MRYPTVKRTFTLLFGTVSLGLQLMSANAENSNQSTANAEAAQKTEAVRASMLELEKARSAYAAGRYTDAESYYRASLALLPVVPATQKQVDFIKLSLADALLAKAMDYRKVGLNDAAIEFLEEGLKLSPKDNHIRRQLEITRDPVRNNPAISPEHIAKVGEVERLLTLAYGQYGLGNFDLAIESFRKVLAIDPFNTSASRGIESVLVRISAAHRAGYDAARARALEEVDATVQSRPDETQSIMRVEDTSMVSLTPSVDESGNLVQALENIHITQLNFEDSSIDDIVAIIRARLKQAVQEGKIPASQSNITTNFGNAQSASFRASRKLRLNQSYQELSLKDILDGVKRQLGIQYYILPNGIEISYSGRDFGPMKERSFIVHPDFFKEEDSSSKEDDFLDSAPKSGLSIKRVDPTAHLKSMGVSFPEGAYAQYSLHTRSLIVRNTLHNIDEIAGLIDYSPKSAKKQVLINVYVMTVSTEDLKDLGFEWLLNISIGGNTQLDGGAANDGTIPGIPKFEGGIGPNNAHSMSTGLRSGAEVLTVNNIDRLISRGSASSLQNMGPQKSPGIMSFRGVWNSIDLTVLMRGLDQKKNFDLLQNPQLVFTPGREEQVSVYNVREMFYPVAYDAPQVSTSHMLLPIDFGDILVGNFFWNRIATMVTASASHPSEFTYFGMRDEQIGGIGTILQIHSAEIDPAGQFVDIALTTTVNDFDGFVNWGSPLMTAMVMPDEIRHVVLTENKILQPIFKRQMINTQVSVATGSIIVLGGLQESKKIRYEDKIPIMGDIPFVGRLFRSEGSKNEEKALLFFAKVDIVDPTGRDPQTGKNPSEK